MFSANWLLWLAAAHSTNHERVDAVVWAGGEGAAAGHRTRETGACRYEYMYILFMLVQQKKRVDPALHTCGI